MIVYVVFLVIGAIALPAIVFAGTGVSDRFLSRMRPRRAAAMRPWVWMTPLLVLSGAVLVVPLVLTIAFSVRTADAGDWAGLANFVWAFGDAVRPVLANNLVWLTIFPLFTVTIALVLAVLFDRVKYEGLARTLILIPSAISLTAAAVIWRMLYVYQPEGREQLGTVNALVTLFGGSPVPWLQVPGINNVALIVVAVWSSLGVALLVFSAGVKAIPGELVEAARMDGAGEIRLFFSVTLPLLWPTFVTVLTTQVIHALKLFDIVHVMTNGAFGTDVVANKMYTELFLADDIGHASAIAVILLVASLPIIWLNIRQIRREKMS